MSSKWDGVRRALDRAHGDLFANQSRYEATFYSYDPGSYDPNSGEMTGDTRQQIDTAYVERVPPSIDTTVDTDGTNFSWDTTIRFPLGSGSAYGDGDYGSGLYSADLDSALVPLGEDNRRPTEVELKDDTDTDPIVYELHGYKVEEGSGMLMCRLVEQ